MDFDAVSQWANAPSSVLLAAALVYQHFRLTAAETRASQAEKELKEELRTNKKVWDEVARKALAGMD